MSARTATKNDVVDLLLEQHAQIERLFREVMEATGDHRRDSFHRLVRLLAVHETAEEEIVHPLARTSIDAGAEVVGARLAEEHEAKELLAALYGAGPDAPDFLPRLLALRKAVLTHATYEERYEFPHLRAAHPDGTLERLTTALKVAQATAPTRPHPGVETATENLLVGPFAAVYDRIRDAVRDAGKKPSSG